MNNILFSSNSNEWETPINIFNELNNEFNFNLDPCSSDNNYKCEKHYTIKENGLLQNWQGSRVFVNPPYGRNLYKWVEKCYIEGHKDNTLVVMLIPARTDTKYFHDFIYNKSEIRFIKGRLHFNNSKNAAPFPSMIVIYR